MLVLLRRVLLRATIPSEPVQDVLQGRWNVRFITSPSRWLFTPQPSQSFTTFRAVKQLDNIVPEVSAIPTPPVLAQHVPKPILETASLQSLLASSTLRNKHVLSVSQFERTDLDLLFAVARKMHEAVRNDGGVPVLSNRVLSIAFYEPSTRTSASFDAAMQRLGGRVIAINPENSSLKKGETLQDTIRTLACYTDAIVLRHCEDNSASIAASHSPVPIINGGNGSLEHPTQALLDLFTMQQELGCLDGLTITFVGDLKYGRTVHSLVKLLGHYDVQLNLVSSEKLAIPSHVLQDVKLRVNVSNILTPQIVSQSDVLYCTRLQQERFDDAAKQEQCKLHLVIDNALMKHAKAEMIVMHPLPRNSEISEEVDRDQRAAYFRQMKYGLYTRMALLALVLEAGNISENYQK